MIRARCQEPGCTWTFEAEDFEAVNIERDKHFMSHPWTDRTQRMPRYPSASDDRQVSTGFYVPPRDET